MAKFLDLTGNTYGRLTVLGRGESAINTYGRPIARWNVVCECGKKTLVRGTKLTGETTKSCGCLQKEICGNTMRTHGKRHTRAYNSWAGMKDRCNNPKSARFSEWGGRGIKICDRWINSFENFFSDMGDPPKGMTIDRIDNNGNYHPANCRWATQSQQSNNQRSTRFFERDGKRMTVTEWALHFGVTRNVINIRMRRGATFDTVFDALSSRLIV